MSKIITKKQLNLVMESSIEEAGHCVGDDMVTKESACNECGGTMVEGVCEGCSEISEDKEVKPDFLDLDNDGDKEEPMKDAAKEEVVEESVNKLTESLSETTKKEIMKEEIDFFNKMINYKK